MKKIFTSITQNTAYWLLFLFLMSKLHSIAQAPVKVWDAYYSNGISTMAGMVTDAYGNVYVTGVTDSANYQSIVTVKYNGQCVQQWLSVYSGLGNPIMRLNTAPKHPSQVNGPRHENNKRMQSSLQTTAV
jgi:hypothetical protein